MITLTIDTSGLIRKLKEVDTRIADAKPFLKVVGNYMVESVRQNFGSHGRPEQWKQTIWGTPALFRTGALYKSIKITELDKEHVTISSNSKGNIHNFGYDYIPSAGQRRYLFYWLKRTGKYDKGKLKGNGVWNVPARPFYMFQDKDVEFIKQKFIEYIEKGYQ